MPVHLGADGQFPSDGSFGKHPGIVDDSPDCLHHRLHRPLQDTGLVGTGRIERHRRISGGDLVGGIYAGRDGPGDASADEQPQSHRQQSADYGKDGHHARRAGSHGGVGLVGVFTLRDLAFLQLIQCCLLAEGRLFPISVQKRHRLLVLVCLGQRYYAVKYGGVFLPALLELLKKLPSLVSDDRFFKRDRHFADSITQLLDGFQRLRLFLRRLRLDQHPHVDADPLERGGHVSQLAHRHRDPPIHQGALLF